MWEDPIVAELHKIREAHAAQFNYDVKAIVKALRHQQRLNKRKVVSFAEDDAPETVEQPQDAY